MCVEDIACNISVVFFRHSVCFAPYDTMMVLVIKAKLPHREYRSLPQRCVKERYHPVEGENSINNWPYLGNCAIQEISYYYEYSDKGRCIGLEAFWYQIC